MSTPEVLPNSIAESMQHTGESAIHAVSHALQTAGHFIDTHTSPETSFDDSHSSSYAALSAAGDSSVEGAVSVEDIKSETSAPIIEQSSSVADAEPEVAPVVFAVQEPLEEASFYMD